MSVCKGEKGVGRDRDCKVHVSEFRIGPAFFFTRQALQRSAKSQCVELAAVLGNRKIIDGRH